ncbi:hypothetical protein ACTFIV_005423 [Dictyostelium citrinum]
MFQVNKENTFSNQDIAVIGIGCRLPGECNSPDIFFQKLTNKLDAIQTVPETRFSKSFFDTGLITSDKGGYLKDDEWKKFDSIFFSINPKETALLDPQQRVLLKCLWEAFEDANIKPESVRGSNTACFIGLTTTDYGKINGRSFPFLNSYWCHGNAGCFFSNRLSFSYDLRGTSLSIETACSSSMNAIFMGIKALQSGIEDMAVVGGTNCIFDPTEPLIFSQNEMLSKKMGRCRSFEDCADGYIRSEGAGIIILKRANDAIRDGDRIYSIVKGGSSNMDGQNHKDNILAPSMHAQKENIEIALKRSKLNPANIDFVECHGTGTPTGDPTEVESVSMVFKDHHSKENPLRIGSVKTNIGHMEAASGVASFIKVCLSLKHRKFIPNIHFERINPKIKIDEWNLKVQTELEDFPTNLNRPVAIGINNFGMSGSNVHLILEEPPRYIENENHHHQSEKKYLIPFSSNSINSLDRYLNIIKKNAVSEYSEKMKFKDFVKNHCLSKTLFSGARNIISANDWNGLNEIEKSTLFSPSTISDFKKANQSPIIFVFAGQGPQYIGMHNQLYSNNQVYRNTLIKVDQLLKKHFKYSVFELVNSLPNNSNEINKPINAQPYLFLLQISIVEVYKYWGIEPSIVLGHSFGEVAAAYCSNIIDLETACTITYYRATLQNKTVGSGRMLSIGLSENEYINQFSNQFPNLEISCFNSDDSIVISGAENELELLSTVLQNNNIFSSFLSSLTAFHSSKQEIIKDEFYNPDLLNIKYTNKPMKLFFSTHYGEQLTEKSQMNVDYIYNNIRNPVKFSKAIKSVFKYLENQQGSSFKNPVIIEISPTPTLAYYIKKSIPSDKNFKPLVLTSLNKKISSQIESFNSTIMALYRFGLNLNFECQFSYEELDDHHYKDTTSSLPRYQWDDELYWSYPLESKKKILDGPSTDLLGKKSINGVETYHSMIDTSNKIYKFLYDHRVKGKVLFPGSGYIDNILNIFKGKDILIHNLEFNVPVFINEGNKYELQTNLFQSSKNEYKVEFYFRTDLKSEQLQKVSHGRFTVYPPTPSNTIPMIDLDQLKEKCNLAIMSKQDVYKKCSTMGLDYGYHFQHIDTLYIGNNCSFSKMNLNPATSTLDNKNFLNASIMDSFIHGFITILEGRYELVFERLENFTYYESNIPSVRPDYVYLFATIESQRGNNATGKLLVYSEEGKLLVSYGGVIVNSLIKNKPIEMKNPSNYLYSINWQQKDLPITFNEINNSNDINEIVEKVIKCGKNRIYHDGISSSKSLIKILDSGLNIENSTKLIQLIKSKIKNNNLIEYTKLCKDQNNIDELKKQIRDNSNVFKFLSTIDKNENLIGQGLLNSNYDLIINNEFNGNQFNNLYQTLTPNGFYISTDNETIIMCKQKPSIRETILENSYNKIITFSSSLFNNDKDNIQVFEPSELTNLNGQDRINEMISNNEKVLIIYSPGEHLLNVQNFKDKSWELTNLIQLIIKNKHEDKVSICLLTMNSQLDCENYLGSSLIGSYRYFKTINNLNLISIDIERESLSELNLSLVSKLSNKSVTGDSEFAIRDNIIYVKRIFETPEIYNDNGYENCSDQDKTFKLNLELNYIPHSKEDLGENDVEIQVMAVGVNYKDSLYYRALLPQEVFAKGNIYNPPLGLECSGIISRIGSKVTKFKLNDQVAGLVPHSFSSFIVVKQSNIVHKPNNISFVEAASIPMVYMSAYYSLYHLGRLENNETVLIHSACGGVGLAALKLLKSRGHSGNVFVTIGGSKEKKRYLLENYGDIITKVLSTETSSVSKRFSDRIKEINGKGVDLVLDTLSGEFMKYNFDSLSEIGRISCLSMTQLIDNDNIDLNNFRYNVGYNTIDIERVCKHNPKITNNILSHLFREVGNGKLGMIPITEFRIEETKDAIDFVNDRKHIGKIVVNFQNFEQYISNTQINKNIIKTNYKINSLPSTLLITGQTGISPIIIKWIINHAPNHLRDIIIISKSNCKWEAKKLINQQHRGSNIKIHFFSIDVSNYDELNNSINNFYNNNKNVKPVGSIIHLATIYEYLPILDIDKNHLERTYDPKVVGAYNLYKLSVQLNWSLKQFLLFSSVASITGMENQLAYTSANATLDAFANYLNRNGYCNAKSISWGALDGSGEAANNRSVGSFLKSQGYEFVLISKILGSIFIGLKDDKSIPSHFMVSKFNYPLFLESNKHMKISMDYLLNSEQMELKQKSNVGDDLGDSILNRIIYFISDLLSISSEKLNVQIPLKSYGIDSLLTVQLKNYISSEFGVSFTHLQLSTNSIEYIANKVQLK